MNIKTVRSEIIKQLNSWFAQKLQIDERLLQILEYSPYCKGGWMDSADIFSATIETMPSIPDILMRAGIDEVSIKDSTKELRKLKSFRINKNSHNDFKKDFNIEGTLNFSFGDGYFEKTDTYKKIKNKGNITVIDLLEGVLSVGEIGYQINNELTGSLLKNSDHEYVYWDRKNKKFINELVNKIRILENIDQSIGNQQFLLHWDGKNYRFSPFGATGIYQFSNEPLKDGSLFIARGNVIQPIQRFKEEAFDELEYLINNQALEEKFQSFFERNPEFLLALNSGKYVDIHPQVVLHEDNGERLIPDFMLEKVNDHFCDICDLKLATQTIKKFKRHRSGFRAVIHEAISQLETYRNWFEDKHNRDLFNQRTGLKAYRPKVVLIVGRNLDYYSDIERIQKEDIFPKHVEVVPYDEVLLRARLYKSLVK